MKVAQAAWSWAAVSGIVMLGCGSSAADERTASDDSGAADASGSGGVSGVGGSTKGSGGAKQGTGGASGTGGAKQGTGGASGTGGATGTGSGGASGTGGATGTGGSSVHSVGACSDLSPIGVWENITPADLHSENWCLPGSPKCQPGQLGTYGANAFALDPGTSGTVVLGMAGLGIWRTTDCGSTWQKADTGVNGDALDRGRQWSMVIDPTDGKTLYTVAGYAGPGLYKTTNGGTDWQQMFPANMLVNLPAQGVEKVAMSPTNHLHLTASFHNACGNSPTNGGPWACMADSTDGGSTWRLLAGPADWNEGDGQTMMDDKVWFFSNGGGYISRTENAGATWTTVYNGFSQGDYVTGGWIYTASNGTYYTAGSRGMVSSKDGIHWTILAGGPALQGAGQGSMVDDGTTLYGSLAYYFDPPQDHWIWSTTLASPASWKTVTAPTLMHGGFELKYDADHGLLYSTNSPAGFWRVRIH
jgi:hypothetical protein